MVYQHPMFTHRVCCCSAIAASQVMACIAIIVCAIVAVSQWFTDTPLYLNIYQTVLLVAEIIACVLVFVSCCTMRPVLMLPIIVIQAWNTISIIGVAIWVLIDVWYIYDLWGDIYLICMYLFSIMLSLFILHCHVCCFKLLTFKKHACHHHCGPSNYA